MKRLVFRFLFVYAFLYYLPFPLTLVAKEGVASKLWARAEEPVVLWIARHVFRATREIRTGFETGSGDTTYDWFRVGALVLVAALAAIAWWARERGEHPRLAAALRVYVRYAVGSALVAYGMYKLIPVQFPAPAPERLVQTLGELSPMGFLWTFMGHSPAYNAFAGTGELVGGLLLFFRRTTMLGALVVAGVMANVVALNFTYDVPVKLYSSHLLLSAVLLLAPDASRLLGMFVLNRATRPRHDVLRLPAWTRAVKLGFVSWVVGSLLVEVRGHHARPRSRRERAAR